MVGENNKMKIDQVEDIKRKLVRINGGSLDEDSKEDGGSSDDDSSLENKELVEKEGVINTNMRDAIIIEYQKEITKDRIIESLNKTILEKGNMAKFGKKNRGRIKERAW